MSATPTSVVAIGEALTDVVERPGAEPVEHPGGSPMNIALGLARLGRAVTLITDIGTDERGSRIIEHLRSAGASLASGSIREKPTSTATARLRADGSADYVFDLHWSLPAGLTADDPVFADAGVVHAGSIGAFLEPGGAAVVDLLTRLTASGRRPLIAFDPNIRPTITPDRDQVRARFERLARLSSFVKLSEEDAEWLYPERGPDETVSRILESGPGLVALTRGGDGAVLQTRGAWYSATATPTDVADTIGAGDSFMSALIDGLAGLLDEGFPAEELRGGRALGSGELKRLGDHAVRCAAMTVSRPGADPPTRSELAIAPGEERGRARA